MRKGWWGGGFTRRGLEEGEKVDSYTLSQNGTHRSAVDRTNSHLGVLQYPNKCWLWLFTLSPSAILFGAHQPHAIPRQMHLSLFDCMTEYKGPLAWPLRVIKIRNTMVSPTWPQTCKWRRFFNARPLFNAVIWIFFALKCSWEHCRNYESTSREKMFRENRQFIPSKMCSSGILQRSGLVTQIVCRDWK